MRMICNRSIGGGVTRMVIALAVLGLGSALLSSAAGADESLGSACGIELMELNVPNELKRVDPGKTAFIQSTLHTALQSALTSDDLGDIHPLKCDVNLTSREKLSLNIRATHSATECEYEQKRARRFLLEVSEFSTGGELSLKFTLVDCNGGSATTLDISTELISKDPNLLLASLKRKASQVASKMGVQRRKLILAYCFRALYRRYMPMAANLPVRLRTSLELAPGFGQYYIVKIAEQPPDGHCTDCGDKERGDYDYVIQGEVDQDRASRSPYVRVRIYHGDQEPVPWGSVLPADEQRLADDLAGRILRRLPHFDGGVGR
jgi:hypothetical protein